MHDEARLLLRYLDAQRNHVLSTVDGLTDEQLRQPVLPSGWHFLGMLKHLALGDERYWFRSIVAGEPLDLLDNGPGSDWCVADDEAATDVIDLYRFEIEQSNAIISTTPLDRPPLQKDPRWRTWRADFTDVRDIVLHVITETACHAGHLDAAREVIDGQQWLRLQPAEGPEPLWVPGLPNGGGGRI